MGTNKKDSSLNLGIGDALRAVADIMQLVKSSPEGQERRNLKLAARKLKKLKKQLAKDGWENWEKEMYKDLTKAYAEQLKKLMN